jgi:hypothetical protein
MQQFQIQKTIQLLSANYRFFGDSLTNKAAILILIAIKSASITYLRGGGEKNTGGTTGRTRVFFGRQDPK